MNTIMNSFCAKISIDNLGVGDRINLAVCERIFDDGGLPLSDSIIGECDCVILARKAYWNDQPHGISGRYYEVAPIGPLPRAKPGRQIVIGIE